MLQGCWEALALYADGSQGGLRLFPLLDDHQVSEAATAIIDNHIKSKKAIVLAPFHSHFGSSDMAPPVYTLLTESSCPKLT